MDNILNFYKNRKNGKKTVHNGCANKINIQCHIWLRNLFVQLLWLSNLFEIFNVGGFGIY